MKIIVDLTDRVHTTRTVSSRSARRNGRYTAWVAIGPASIPLLREPDAGGTSRAGTVGAIARAGRLAVFRMYRRSIGGNEGKLSDVMVM